MKTNVMMTTAVLAVATGFSAFCIAASPQGEEPDPAQLMDLLDESSTEPAVPVQSLTNEPVAQPSETAAGGQVQRLLEESELILRGIAADAAPLRDELQKGYTHALDVVRGYLDRLPKRAETAQANVTALDQEEGMPITRNLPAQAETNTEHRVAPQPVEIESELEPTWNLAPEAAHASSASEVADAQAKFRVNDALLEAAGKLREIAAVATKRAEELEHMSKALEEARDE